MLWLGWRSLVAERRPGFLSTAGRLLQLQQRLDGGHLRVVLRLQQPDLCTHDAGPRQSTMKLGHMPAHLQSVRLQRSSSQQYLPILNLSDGNGPFTAAIEHANGGG